MYSMSGQTPFRNPGKEDCTSLNKPAKLSAVTPDKARFSDATARRNLCASIDDFCANLRAARVSDLTDLKGVGLLIGSSTVSVLKAAVEEGAGVPARIRVPLIRSVIPKVSGAGVLLANFLH